MVFIDDVKMSTAVSTNDGTEFGASTFFCSIDGTKKITINLLLAGDHITLPIHFRPKLELEFNSLLREILLFKSHNIRTGVHNIVFLEKFCLLSKFVALSYKGCKYLRFQLSWPFDRMWGPGNWWHIY